MTYQCANPDCKMQLLDPRPVDLITEPLKVGNILVCGACLNASVVGLMEAKLLSPEEFESLSDGEKNDLRFAVRALARQQKN